MPAPQLANRMGAINFPQTHDLSLNAIRGQMIYINGENAPKLAQVLYGDGYLTPA
ncbi:MAG: hypothetical protein H7240_01425 [Glaciimonas sp.]|nr:hypothetical protein [Glaciimonas sp.]